MYRLLLSFGIVFYLFCLYFVVFFVSVTNFFSSKLSTISVDNVLAGEEINMDNWVSCETVPTPTPFNNNDRNEKSKKSFVYITHPYLYKFETQMLNFVIAITIQQSS